MIGYYVHHRGSGHLHRATAVAAELGLPVTGLSSLPRPVDWSGDWVHLPSDATDPSPLDVTAAGRLHWAPMFDDGLRSRMAKLSSWIERVEPHVIVCDVSVEVALLARLHGVAVVSVVLPGDRGDDPHRLGFGVSTELVAVWPREASGMVRGLSDADSHRLHRVGGLSRFPVRPLRHRRPGHRRVTVLLGDGDGVPTAHCWETLHTQAPDWDWTVLGRQTATWTDDPYGDVCDADVVVTHAGQNAVAEVAAARRPAIIVPAPRPHDEQVTTAAVLRSGDWPALVEMTFPSLGWAGRLEEVAAYDPAGWQRWTDGEAAGRFADVVRSVLAIRQPG